MQTGRPSKYPRPPFGKRLHSAREALGYSQTQVAEKLGITQTAYAFWERHPVALRPEQIVKISEILKIPVEQLLGVNNKKVRGAGPVGKVRRIFDEVSKLPRQQQNKVVEFLQNYIRGLNGNTSNL